MRDHQSVLINETLEALSIKKGETYIDATLNGGGHAGEILKRDGRVFGIDIDPEAIKKAAKAFSLKLSDEEGRLFGKNDLIAIAQSNFSDLKQTAFKFGVWETPGVLFDLGLSSLQLDNPERGLSFSKEGPIDMRLDPTLQVTAADLINGLSQGELNELFFNYGEEHASRSIARAIVKARLREKIRTTTQLVKIIEQVVRGRGKIHPATKIFQALRITVNNELENLEKGLEGAEDLLKKGGRLVVISFHSLEDRVVKNYFKKRWHLTVLTKKPIVPGRDEILNNPRSRSAKMRVAQRV
ncbi:MAG: 16S rRNA (cytosine(1402)-N(4))-methyltransferase RsmH [Candidatus Woykebacteria bacterium]